MLDRARQRCPTGVFVQADAVQDGVRRDRQRMVDVGHATADGRDLVVGADR
jgi:hypothetical protein